MKTIIVIEVEHRKPVADLSDHAAQRIYTMDAVDNVKVLGEMNRSTWPFPMTFDIKNDAADSKE